MCAPVRKPRSFSDLEIAASQCGKSRRGLEKPSLSGSSSKRSWRSTGRRGKPRPDPRQVLRMMASENTEKFADLRGRVTYTCVRAPTRPTVLTGALTILSPPRAASGRFGPHLGQVGHPLARPEPPPHSGEALRLQNGRLTAGIVARPQPAPAVWKPLPRVRTAWVTVNAGG